MEAKADSPSNRVEDLQCRQVIGSPAGDYVEMLPAGFPVRLGLSLCAKSPYSRDVAALGRGEDGVNGTIREDDGGVSLALHAAHTREILDSAAGS